MGGIEDFLKKKWGASGVLLFTYIIRLQHLVMYSVETMEHMLHPRPEVNATMINPEKAWTR